MKNLEIKVGKALVLVAHPDDETIWMGGAILKHPNISWTIFSLCRKNDPDRCPKFLRVAKFYGAKGIISNLDDEGKLTLKESLPEIKRRIYNELKTMKFDYIFTHGLNGEYGHERHRGAHLVVRTMVQGKELLAGNLFFFSYEKNNGKKFCVPNTEADFYLKLSEKELETKRNVIKNLYGFNKFSFENRSCTKIETFDKFR